MDYRIDKQDVLVSKKEYIEYWILNLKRMKQHLTAYKIATTKELNIRKKEIDKVKKELIDINNGSFEFLCEEHYKI